MMRLLFTLLWITVALAWTGPSQAAESYANCAGVVTSLPTVISTPGTWCVKQNLTTAGAAVKGITISADNVTLDCNDFALSNTAGTANSAVGISAANRLNATVRHCKVVGFRYGVYLQATTGGGNHVVEDSLFDGNTYAGIRVEGNGSVVQRNQVLNTGGSTNLVGAYGIYAVDSVNISGNTVDGVVVRPGSNGKAYGIVTLSNLYGGIVGNRVRGMAKDGTGLDFGISNISSGRIVLRDNDVFGDGSAGSVGLSCTNSTGRAKNNMINGFAKSLNKCGDGGDNDLAP